MNTETAEKCKDCMCKTCQENKTFMKDGECGGCAQCGKQFEEGLLCLMTGEVLTGWVKYKDFMETDMYKEADAVVFLNKNGEELDLSDEEYVDLSVVDARKSEKQAGLLEIVLQNYISKKMIEDGLMAKVIVPKLEDGVLVCQIGEHWFYFGGSEFETTDPKDIPFDILVEEIKSTLDDFYKHPETFDTEYLYYYYYLCENI